MLSCGLGLGVATSLGARQGRGQNSNSVNHLIAKATATAWFLPDFSGKVHYLNIQMESDLIKLDQIL